MLTVAVDAADILKSEHGIGAKVVNLPWLNHVDSSWLASEVANYKAVVSLDNHYRQGGQGDRIGDALHAIRRDCSAPLPSFARIALEEIPESGTNLEVLGRHKLDRDSVVKTVLSASC
jgi:transketolase